MADVTAQLIWYRLKENYESLAESYRQFSWRRVDILDMLFLGWLGAAFLVVGLVNLYLRVFGLPKVLQRRRGLDGGGGGGNGRSLDGQGSAGNSTGGVRGGETALWINAVVGWLCENYDRKQALVELWVKALTEEARKYSEKDIHIRFDGIQPGSSSPQFSNISTDSRDKQTLTVLANLMYTDVTLLVSVVAKTATHMQTTGCQVRISKLFGPLRIQWKTHDSPEHLLLSFYSTPELDLQVSPNSYGSNIESSLVKSVIHKVISKVVLHLPFPNGRGLDSISRAIPSSESPRSTSFNKRMISDAKELDGKDVAGSPFGGSTRPQELSIGFVQPFSGDQFSSKSDGQPHPPGLRLLVKLIKANGLMDKDFTSCDPYCTVSADDPPQQHSTSVVKNTINPFFDEYFLLDTNVNTRLVKFEVYDRSKPKGDDLLGQASVSIEDLRRMPSSRQIIPLTGRPRVTTATSGSVTVEFLFMESNESSSRVTALESSPPRRRIEMSRALMPGGMTVTTKTTTTERLRDHRDDPSKFNVSPTRVEKTETVSNYASDSSPYPSGTSSRGGNQSSTPSTSQDQIVTNGLESVTEAALHQLSRQPNVPSQSATVIITSVVKEKSVPTNKAAKSPNTKQSKDTLNQSAAEHQQAHEQLESLHMDDSEGLETKKKSFASALKKRFTRNKKARSQSADRAQTFHDEGHTRPPEQIDTTFSDQSEFPEGTLRKSRSHSFSSSFRNLFRRKKKSNISRESSMSKISARGAETSCEGSIAQPSPQLSQSKGSAAHHHTPRLSPTTGYPYSTSVPARPAPLYDH